jgi:hypothetical protein
MNDYSFATPGVGTSRTHTPRQVLLGSTGARHLPVGKIIDGSKSRDPLNTGDLDVLRNGLPMGKITASGKYAPSVIGALTVAFTASQTMVTVSAATATEISRRIGSTGTFILTGPPAAAGTVADVTATYSAVNTSTGVITITAITSANWIAGSLVRPTDGSQTIKGLLDEEVKVTDVDGTSQDTRLSKLLVSGYVDASEILNYPSDTSLKAWLKDQLNDPSDGPGPFSFDDNF